MVFKFTIDNVVNKYLPPNRLDRTPKYVRRFLGRHKPKPRDDYWIWLDILVSTFCSMAMLEGVYRSNNALSKHGAVVSILGGYAATSILCFNVPDAPVAQPRCVFFGHFMSSLIGICMQRLFSLSHAGRANYWACGPLSVAIASVAMTITGCVHPPGGASAYIPSSSEAMIELGWWLLPIQIVSSVLMLATALLTVNILRAYPIYWWTSKPLGHNDEAQLQVGTAKISEYITSEEVHISKDGLYIPPDLELTDLEMEWLETIQLKMKSADGQV